MKQPQQTDLLKIICKALDDKFGTDIMVLDISQISTMADYFVIASGNNPSQMKAMSDEVLLQLQKAGVLPEHTEGYGTANWILLDFGNIIIHLFDRENRQFYSLERIWADAKQLDVKALLQ